MNPVLILVRAWAGRMLRLSGLLPSGYFRGQLPQRMAKSLPDAPIMESERRRGAKGCPEGPSAIRGSPYALHLEAPAAVNEGGAQEMQAVLVQVFAL